MFKFFYLSIEIEGCDCKYHGQTGVGDIGGCKISIAPPKGYKCECIYKLFWTCGGQLKRWISENDYGCRGCAGVEGCTGDYYGHE